MFDFHKLLQQVCGTVPPELSRPVARERHFLLDGQLGDIYDAAARRGCWLVSLLACDERELEDNAFKVYCVLSTPARELITLEHRLDKDQATWHSIGAAFPGALRLEREMADLFGLKIEPPLAPDQLPVLVGAYPQGYAPLLRDATALAGAVSVPAPPPPEKLPEGLVILPVGPIHAGVIQPGYFAFHVAGEVVEKLPVQLGFTHRGVEKLFEGYVLADGWQLAERVAGDSAFAHSLAYCQAVESLAGFEVPEGVSQWRGLILELERIANHMADCAAIVHDMAFDRPSSRMTVVQERLVRLGAELTGSRLLKGINRPGTVVFPDPKRASRVLTGLELRLKGLVKDFLDLAIPVMEMPECRDRMISTGVLTRGEARSQGATGLPARASLLLRDFRWRHPNRFYAGDNVRRTIWQTFATGRRANGDDRERRILIRRRDLTGDVFARTLLRLAEIETSCEIAAIAAKALIDLGEPRRLEQSEDPSQSDPAQPEPAFLAALPHVHNFDFGVGCVEGWRGEICYWVMKGPRGGIYRCKVRDPSVFNWAALAKAVERKDRRPDEPGSGDHHENILADFPLINKSFNLSYAGTDL